MRFSRIILSCCAAVLVAGAVTACNYSRKGTDPEPKESNEYTVGSSESSLSDAIMAGSHTLIRENSSGDFDTDFYLGETVFVGDSRTNGFILYNLLPPEQVYAVDGSNQKSIQGKKFIQLDQSGVKYTVDQAVAIRNPQRILVGFGINAISVMEESEFMEEYRALVESLAEASPESTIIIQSILPVAWWKKQVIPEFDNEVIDHYNDLLYRYASEKGYYYLNTAEIMKDEKNSLNPNYDAGDGLHFTVKAYRVLLQYYRTHPVPNATD